MKKIVSSYERFFSKEEDGSFKITETSVYVFKDNDKLVEGLFEIEIKVSRQEEYEENGEIKEKTELVSFKRMVFIEIGRSRVEIIASVSPVMTSCLPEEGKGKNEKKVGLINHFTVSRITPSINGGEETEKIINEVKTQIGS